MHLTTCDPSVTYELFWQISRQTIVCICYGANITLVLVMNVLDCGLLHASWLHHRVVCSMWTWSQLAWWQHWAHYRICMGSTRWMPLWWSWRRLLVCSWWCPSWGLWVATLWMMVVSTSPACTCIIWSTYWSVWRTWWIRSGPLCR